MHYLTLADVNVCLTASSEARSCGGDIGVIPLYWSRSHFISATHSYNSTAMNNHEVIPQPGYWFVWSERCY
jgi:hypothetical protein